MSALHCYHFHLQLAYQVIDLYDRVLICDLFLDLQASFDEYSLLVSQLSL